MEIERNEDTRIQRGYPNPVGYGFVVLVFISIKNCDMFVFEEGKIHPAPLSCLFIWQSKKFKICGGILCNSSGDWLPDCFGYCGHTSNINF
jgi:hypothetical protein